MLLKQSLGIIIVINVKESTKMLETKDTWNKNDTFLGKIVLTYDSLLSIGETFVHVSKYFSEYLKIIPLLCILGVLSYVFYNKQSFYWNNNWAKIDKDTI